MIAITGATGNIGAKIAENLIKRGEAVRCIARGREKLDALAAKGAEVAPLDLTDTDTLAEAFAGADAVFAMIPPNYGAADFRAYQNEVGESIAQAVDRAGVGAVVHLSSQGGHLPDKTGPIKGLYDQEQRLNRRKNVNVLHLRPTYFMENLFMSLDAIRSRNIMAGAIEADLKIPMIATADIAAYAAERLSKRDFSGHTVKDLLGQRDLSMNDAAEIIGEKIGKPDLQYVQVSYADMQNALVSMGASEDAAGLFAEMTRAFNDGLIKTPRTAENTTETPFETFAEGFAAALS